LTYEPKDYQEQSLVSYSNTYEITMILSTEDNLKRPHSLYPHQQRTLLTLHNSHLLSRNK